MHGHDIEQLDMFGAGSHHKRLWLVPPAGQLPDGFLPGLLLEFRLTPSQPGKAVRLAVFRRGHLSLTMLGEREFANPRLAVAFVQAEVDCYRARGWTLRSELPPHAPPSQIKSRAEALDAGRHRQPVSALTPRVTKIRMRVSRMRAQTRRRDR
jgi:hypothetical protein